MNSRFERDRYQAPTAAILGRSRLLLYSRTVGKLLSFLQFISFLVLMDVDREEFRYLYTFFAFPFSSVRVFVIRST